MQSARLIVCEAKSRWTPALRTILADDAARLIACGLRATCESWLVRFPASLVVLETPARSIDESLRWIAGVAERWPHARVVPLLPADLDRRQGRAMEAALIEAGALAVFGSPLEATRIVELARRHFALVPTPTVGFAQQAWDELPWSEAR